MSLIDELNKIARSETEIPWYWMCRFCGKKSQYGRWMFKHVLSHLKRCMPVCEDCGDQHLPDPFSDYEETLDAHTITVAPNHIYRGLHYLGFWGN